MLIEVSEPCAGHLLVAGLELCLFALQLVSHCERKAQEVSVKTVSLERGTDAAAL